ncbi:SigE family RNA polymerase sigma factor [Micromonospora sp. NPDC049051]|uniref:SigE family RNA polymerase sigma factor n=1 Tax=Micromonospora sp. NPDC049051 TaxID=3364264 RepID=UPI0037131545
MSRDPLEEEFRDFVAARSGALLRTAYLLSGDWATAEDLLQTALTKTYLAWKRLGGIEAIEPYARRVMINTSTSWWRRRWHGERPTEVLPERAGVDEIEQQLDRDLLWRHLRGLPSRQRAVLVLRFYEDMSEAQTAALLGISPGTVKSQTSRALGTLRRRMGAEAALDLPAEADPTSARADGTDRSTSAHGGTGRPAPVAGGTGRPGPAHDGTGRPAPAHGSAGRPGPAQGGTGRPAPAHGGGRTGPAHGGVPIRPSTPYGAPTMVVGEDAAAVVAATNAPPVVPPIVAPAVAGGADGVAAALPGRARSAAVPGEGPAAGPSAAAPDAGGVFRPAEPADEAVGDPVPVALGARVGAGSGSRTAGDEQLGRQAAGAGEHR